MNADLINESSDIVGRDFEHFDKDGVYFVDGQFFTYEQLENLVAIYGEMDFG